MTKFDATIKDEGDFLTFYLESDKAKEVLQNQSDKVRQAFVPCANMLKWSGIHPDRRSTLKNFCKSNGLTYSNI